MRRISKQVWSLILVFALFMSLLGSPSLAAESVKMNYISLGDSLAVGQTPYKKIDNVLGFSDFTANVFQEKNVLGSYTKEFAKSGFKTSEVLKGLQTDAKLQEAVKKANVISISAGANDILSLITNIDLNTGTITFDQSKVPAKLQELTKNYTEILATIKALNPNAKVYLMGIYFPFPYLKDPVQMVQLASIAKFVNTTIENVATIGDATFVSVYDRMGGDNVEALKKVLPNPVDIHPDETGYKMMSEALLEAISKQTTPEQPKPEPIVPNDIKGHPAKEEIMYLINKNLIKVDDKGLFNPYKEITRAEAAMTLYASIASTDETIVNPGFKDIPVSHPAYKAIAKLTAMGVFAKAEKFNADASLQRVQLAKIVSLTYHLKTVGKPVVFKDVPAKYWASDYIQAVATNKIMLGNAGKFDLYSPTTRAQFALVAVRSIKNIQK